MTEATEPRPVGRPSEYDPAYCATVIAFGEAGKSKAYMAAKIGVARQTLENWSVAHPEFLDALTHAMALSQAWWEDAGQNGLKESKFNGSVWSRSMAARFPEDWRERTSLDLSGQVAVTPVLNVSIGGAEPQSSPEAG